MEALAKLEFEHKFSVHDLGFLDMKVRVLLQHDQITVCMSCYGYCQALMNMTSAPIIDLQLLFGVKLVRDVLVLIRDCVGRFGLIIKPLLKNKSGKITKVLLFKASPEDFAELKLEDALYAMETFDEKLEVPVLIFGETPMELKLSNSATVNTIVSNPLPILVFFSPVVFQLLVLVLFFF
jgi:hypothetical protein